MWAAGVINLTKVIQLSNSGASVRYLLLQRQVADVDKHFQRSCHCEKKRRPNVASRCSSASWRCVFLRRLDLRGVSSKTCFLLPGRRHFDDAREQSVLLNCTGSVWFGSHWVPAVTVFLLRSRNIISVKVALYYRLLSAGILHGTNDLRLQQIALSRAHLRECGDCVFLFNERCCSSHGRVSFFQG